MTATTQDQPALDPLTPNHLAWCLTAAGGSYEWVEVAGQPLGPTDVAIRPRSSALNHMDLWLTRGKPSPPSYPHVAGGDGAGIVIEIGAEVSTAAVGDEVIIDPSIVSADAAQRGYDAPLDRSLQILGEHRWGTHGRRVVVPARNIVRRPANRTWAECAALPVASVTAWRMMRRARVQAGERVLIVGVGGGVSTAAMMVALHLGAEVYVTSSSEAKHEWAIAHGASGACLSSGRFPSDMDVVVESVGPATWDSSCRALRPGGRMVVCGGTSGSVAELNLPRLFFKQHEIIGSTMGSPLEFAELVAAFEDGLAVVVDSVMEIADYPAALERLREGGQLGKIVLDHGV